MKRTLQWLWRGVALNLALGTATAGYAQYPKIIENYNRKNAVIVCRQGTDGVKASLIHPLWKTTPAHTETGANQFAPEFEVSSSTIAAQENWSNAATACSAYNVPNGSKGVWRLPTVRELRLIYALRMELTGCTLPTTGWLWSATTNSSNANQAWMVDFSSGKVSSTTSKSSVAPVLCVRDYTKKYPYMADDNIIVVWDEDLGVGADPTRYPTHEKWTTTPDHVELDDTQNTSGYNTYSKRFQVASTVIADVAWRSDLCASYDTPAGTKGQWRLPTAQECGLIAENHFMHWSTTYWTATRYNDERVWTIDGEYYTGGTESKTNINDVRCVRDL